MDSAIVPSGHTRSAYSASETLLGHYGYLPGILWEAMHDCVIVIGAGHDQASWTARRRIRGINFAMNYCLTLSFKTKRLPQTPPASLHLSK